MSLQIKFGIYGIFNIANGKVYIGSTGSTIGFNERWTDHKRDLKNNNHCNTHLQASWNKYGEKSFEFRIIEECFSNLVLTTIEDAWIKQYRSLNPKHGYNLISANRHFFSIETKKRMSEAKKGIKQTEKTKRKISNSMIGINTWNKNRIIKQKTRDKISKSLIGNKRALGYKHTPEAIEKIRSAIIQSYKNKAVQ